MLGLRILPLAFMHLWIFILVFILDGTYPYHEAQTGSFAKEYPAGLVHAWNLKITTLCCILLRSLSLDR